MRNYTIHYKNGNVESDSFPDKATLIRMLFEGDEQRFKQKVKLLSWTTHSAVYSEDVVNGNIGVELATADINPYGWRGGSKS